MILLTRLKYIIKSPLVKNTLKLSSSSALMMFLPLVVTPILSRLYTPEDYGDWGVFSSMLYIVSAFILLSYENTIVKSDDETEVPNLVALCLIVTALVLIVVTCVFRGGKLLGFDFFVNFPCLPLLLVVLALSALYSVSTNLANRQKQYNSMAVTGIINGLSQAGLRILFGVFPLIAYGLIVGNVLAQALSTFILVFCLRKCFTNGFLRHVSWSRIRLSAIKYKKFPLYDAPARFIEFAVGNLAIIILANYWEKEAVGCFSMVMQFILMQIAIIGSAMANVYYREISENSKGRSNITDVTTRASKITFSLAFLPIAFLALGGDYLLVLFLGDKWIAAGPMALCMSLFSVPVILSEPLLPLFRTLDRQEVRFRVNLVNFFLSLGLLLISAIVTDNLYLSLLAYSISYTILRFVMYRYELKLSLVKLNQVSKWFMAMIVSCYGLAIVRIIPYLS